MTDSFNQEINRQLREGRGQVVDFHHVPEEHRAINAFLRKGAAKNTFETNIESGRITHVDGESVEDGGGGRR